MDDGWVHESAPDGTAFEVKGSWECPDCGGWGTVPWWEPPHRAQACPRCLGKGALWDDGWYGKSCCYKGECD